MLRRSLSLQDEVKVDFPRVSQAIVGVVLDLPEARIASRASVSAPDPDIDVLDGDVPQPVVGRQVVKVLCAHFNRSLMYCVLCRVDAVRMFSRQT